MVITSLWRRRIDTLHHFHIDPRARIGPGLLVAHRNGIRIGPAEIGSNLVVNHNVTIGKRLAAGDKGLPRIGDNVWIGPGSTLSGDITVGDNVTISAGTVLSKSVPDGCLVAGNPGRIIAKDYQDGPVPSSLRVAQGG